MTHPPSTTIPYDWFASPARPASRLPVRQVLVEVSRPLPRRTRRGSAIARAQALQTAQAAVAVLAGWLAFTPARAPRLQPPAFADHDPFWSPDFGDTFPPARPAS